MKARIADDVLPMVCNTSPLLPIKYPFLIVAFFVVKLEGFAVGDRVGNGVGALEGDGVGELLPVTSVVSKIIWNNGTIVKKFAFRRVRQ